MTAGLVVAIMITPIITSITREVFATVPTAQKEAAVALGATRWEMIRGAVFPHSRSGIVGATHDRARARDGRDDRGRVGRSARPPRSPRASLGPATRMAAVIANQFGEATDTYRAALIGVGVVLFAITIVIGVIARAAFVARIDRRSAGGHMTAAGDAPHATRAREAPAPSSRNGVATALHRALVRGRAGSAALIVIYVVRGRHDRVRLRLPDRGHPVQQPVRGRRDGPRGVGTLLITGAATVMAVPLGVLGGIYLNEYGGRGLVRPRRALPRRGHDRRAVDRDGPVRLHDRVLHPEGPGSTCSPARSRSVASCCRS